MEVRMEIAGRSVILRYTVNAMCAVEDVVGGALDAILEHPYTAARLLLWGGMLDKQPEITLSEAGSLLDGHLAGGGTLEAIVEACAEAMRRAGFFGKAA